MAYTPGKGSELQIKISSTYTTVAQITKLTPPSSEMGTVETTTLADVVKTFLSTVRDSGTVGFTVEWDPADTTHVQLFTVHKSGDLTDYKIIFNDTGATEAEFSAILTKFDWDEIDVESVVTIPIELKLSGDITIS